MAARPDAYVVVSGVPGSGKTTLAHALARRLGLPLISKDTIKEALFDSLGTGDLDWSRQLGRAGHVVMCAVARETGPAVLEANFWRGTSEPELEALGAPLIQVHCHCPIDLAVERYRRRAEAPDRHPGHLPEHQADEVVESWRAIEQLPLELEGPTIEVDTAGPVDVEALAVEVERLGERQTRR